MDNGQVKLESESLSALETISRVFSEVQQAREELKSKIDLIHEFRALLTSIRDCPYSNVKQYHKNQIDNLLSRKFKR